jgi:hypothetical protein
MTGTHAPAAAALSTGFTSTWLEGPFATTK